ncbi:uncharacterized phage protein, putative large terminase [Chthonomonas calidirosea]|uniref:phage terminase large subunit n=1 Tax=Chthonomonas calidirosea TaxID=454171 RepID=UPI0006EC8EAA|nr:phage terminase large subunit [Chthonomonas calidirosea]CEK20756.1 uncharacterized phage protein, putative large terminase [Chthonomonas calidirosea]
MSQRLPAWMLAQKPTLRIKLACYNITHATRFSKINLQLLRDGALHDLFPPECRIVEPAQQGMWSTVARAEMRDGQPSFMALGLRTGFVGQGADLLIIDDPYASPQEALSAVIRESVWTFWSAGAKVRIRPETNVVVMFHRYHTEDLAGRLLAEGGWELLRFSAICDGEEEDPMGRAVGERLTHRLSEAFLAEQQQTPSIWFGQFQGRPMPVGGGLIKGAYFRVIGEEQVPPLKQAVMGVDLAVSAKTSADYTVVFPLGVDAEGIYYLFSPARGQWEPGASRRAIAQRARCFAAQHPLRRIGVESVGMAAGLVSEMQRDAVFAGFSVVGVARQTDKVALASVWIPVAEQGRMVLVEDGSGWIKTFIAEAESFPLGAHDDQVDAVGIAFLTLQQVPEKAVYAPRWEGGRPRW